MSGKYRDFDAYWSEISKPSLVCEAYDAKYRIPASFPAETALKLMSLEKNGVVDSITRSELEEVVMTLLGRDQFEDLNTKVTTVSELGTILKRMLTLYKELSETPKRAISAADPGARMADVMASWSRIEADFQKEYALDLSDVLRNVSWRRFMVLMRGLYARRTDRSPMRMSDQSRIDDPSHAESRLRSIGW